jgi:hypothetical protein
MTDEIKTMPTVLSDYWKMAVVIAIAGVGIIGWMITWQSNVERNFARHEAQIEALRDSVRQDRTFQSEGRKEILDELRAIRSEVRAVFLQHVQTEIRRDKEREGRP